MTFIFCYFTYYKMCSKDERDKRIRAMMSRKTEIVTEKMNSVTEKIIATTNENSKFIENSYGVVDPNICPQIADGENYIQNLPKDLQTAIKNYTGSGYGSINRGLRMLKIKECSYYIEKLDMAFKNAPPLTHPMNVYRGVPKLDELRDDNGFSSCSIAKSVSNSFGHGNVFEILLPIGTRVLFVNIISLNRGENEVLIDRSGQFREILPGKLVYMSHLDYE